MRSRLCFWLSWAGLTLTTGCGTELGSAMPVLFAVPLSLNGSRVEDAIVDTGGGFELLLSEDFGLPKVGSIEVVVFGGPEQVSVAGPVRFVAGGIESSAKAALIGVSVCNCNGVGIGFFRKEAVTLTVDFSEPTVLLSDGSDAKGTIIRFERPPARLASLATAFALVDVTVGGQVRRALALFDTGSTATLLQRTLFAGNGFSTADTLRVRLSQDVLGDLDATVGLFSNPALPDMIIGTDVMADWGARWHFTFTPADESNPPGGLIRVERQALAKPALKLIHPQATQR